MSKGRQTRAGIVEQALAVASQTGLSALTIGTLAERSGLSKSGLFAHFGSKEELQLAVVRGVRQLFSDFVFLPAMQHPPGLPRLRAIVENWLKWTGTANLPGGCIMAAAAYEFDDRPGPVKDLISQSLRELRKTLARAAHTAIESGQLRADADPEQLAFEIYSIYLGAQLDARLFGDPNAWRRALAAFENLLSRSGSATAPIDTAHPLRLKHSAPDSNAIKHL
jgi:AcrR family transcriptional regulator